MIISSMTECQISQIAEIEKICFTTPWTERMLEEELENSHACFLVAEEQGMVAGYIGCHMICDEGYIANVAVAPDFRRQGIGKQLVQTLIEEGRKRDLSFISLEVRKGNIPAQTLYAECGFQIAGVRKNFYSHPQEDGLIMTYQVNV